MDVTRAEEVVKAHVLLPEPLAAVLVEVGIV